MCDVEAKLGYSISAKDDLGLEIIICCRSIFVSVRFICGIGILSWIVDPENITVAVIYIINITNEKILSNQKYSKLVMMWVKQNKLKTQILKGHWKACLITQTFKLNITKSIW